MKRREAITVEFTVFRRKPRKTDWWHGKYMIHAYDQVYWVNEIKHAVEIIGEQALLIERELNGNKEDL
jgi:hypothetical protein